MSNRSSLLGAAVVCLSIIAALALELGIAAAHTPRFDDRVTIRDDPQFNGRVASDRAGCERGREVLILREEDGPDGGFGSTATDDDGRWELATGGMLTGDFYAQVKRRVIGRAGHKHVCKADRSRSVSVAP